MDNLIHDNLTIELVNDKSTVKMSWIGASDDRDPGHFLDLYLKTLIVQIAKMELIINFKQLEFMNSSTVPPFIRFIMDLNTNSIKTTIVYNKDSNWQVTSFRALKTIIEKMPNIHLE
jgi:hypothetical protein